MIKSDRELLEGTIDNTAKIGNKVDLIFEQTKDLKNHINNLINNQQILDNKLNNLATLIQELIKK